MDEIQKIAKKHRLAVIEDACHALGAEYKNHRVGSCRYSDMTCFSFHPVKHITTGEGGCITTNNKRFYEKLIALRNHGVYKPEKLKQKHGGWFIEMRELGFNYRISDFQCAMGLIQLKKSDRFLKHRERIARRYQAAFSKLDGSVKLPTESKQPSRHSWHLYLLRLRSGNRVDRRRFYDALKKRGINTHVPYMPIYQHPYYKKVLGKSVQRCPNAEKYYHEVVSLPIFPDLTNRGVQKVIRGVQSALKEISR